MNEYTDSMLEQLRLCSGCTKMHYMTDTKYVTCEGCRTREKPKSNVVLCKSNNCKFKKSDENDYCGKHQLCVFVDETTANGEKVCVNYLRGCRTQLDMSYKYTRCGVCLKKDREKDRAKRGKVAEQNTQIENSESIIANKYCTTCCKECDIHDFVGELHHTITKTCKACRIQNKIQDAKRNKEDRYILERQNQFVAYGKYIKDTSSRNIPFDLTFEQYEHIICESCYYCDITEPEKGFNGIDRKNSDVGYIVENCVSCCKICNKLKGTLDDNCFIRRIGHILSYNNAVDMDMSFPELFGNHIAGKYKKFIKNADERQLTFELSQEQFDEITAENCYICGKQNTEIHKNGIDRFNNAIGYILENCLPCCTECNFMKGIYSYGVFIDKLQAIYNKHKELFRNTNVNTSTTNLYIPEICVQKIKKRAVKEKPTETKTKQQIKEEARLRKKKQRDELKEKLGHAKYKEIRANEMKAYRQNKQEDI
jgi:hypothetical protein